MQRSRYILTAAVLGIVAAGGCRREETAPPAGGGAPPPAPELLIFPPELRAEDERVNQFLVTVLDTCASGDYEAFRMLWSASDDPFPREQFHRAWRSVRQVTVLGLRAVRDADTGQIGYAAWARVELDPAVREPQREVRILLKQEEGQWRLTHPPAPLPDDLFPTTAPANAGATTQPG